MTDYSAFNIRCWFGALSQKDDNRNKLLDWLIPFVLSRGAIKLKPLYLVGPSGIGKTVLLTALKNIDSKLLTMDEMLPASVELTAQTNPLINVAGATNSSHLFGTHNLHVVECHEEAAAILKRTPLMPKQIADYLRSLPELWFSR